jgi:hypothetical protein
MTITRADGSVEELPTIAGTAEWTPVPLTGDEHLLIQLPDGTLLTLADDNGVPFRLATLYPQLA